MVDSAFRASLSAGSPLSRSPPMMTLTVSTSTGGLFRQGYSSGDRSPIAVACALDSKLYAVWKAASALRYFS